MISFNSFLLNRSSLDSVEVENMSNVLNASFENGLLNSGRIVGGGELVRKYRSTLKITCNTSDMDALITDFLNAPETQYTLLTSAPTNIFGETKNPSHLVRIRGIVQDGKSTPIGLSTYFVVVVNV